ncbi:MAG: hypothetical protein D6808_02495, partial [Candidatus Dadabacteria bacterium]
NEQSFIQKYKEHFGEAPRDIGVSSCGYYALKKIVEVYKRKTPSQSLYAALLADFGPQRSLNRRESIYKVEAGRRILLPDVTAKSHLKREPREK